MDTEKSGGIFETKTEAVQQSNGVVSAWLSALSLQEKNEKDWRKKAEEAIKIYGSESEKCKFNILYSNTATISTAIYNTSPLPDIRERYTESAIGKYTSAMLERAVSFYLDTYDFDTTIKSVVLDMCLCGRGIPRVRYVPNIQDGIINFQELYTELVDWDSIILGPAKTWEKMPWLAYKHLMTRDQLIELSGEEIGKLVPLNDVVNCGRDEDISTAPSIFKRSLVYEIWDKEDGTVTFISPHFRSSPLKVMDPPFNLSGFYPSPKPIYYVRRDDSLTPTVPYEIYRQQANELNDVTRRITALTKCLRWRGVYAKGFSAFAQIQDADDGEFLPTESDFQVMAGMGLDKAVLFMPIEQLITVTRELYVQRDQIKQTIYETTGISDILRGSTKATETLGAQQLKAQWGSLRLSDAQNDVQKMCRDLIRMYVEIISENFEPSVIAAVTNMQVTPEVMQLLRSDATRRYTIDVETDSTIRADLSRSQQNVSQFIQGFGGFIQSIGPAVHSGAIPKEVAVELLLSFARNFKLGRQAEAAIEKIKQPQQQQQDPNAAAMMQLQAQEQREANQARAEMVLQKYKIDKDSQTKLAVANMDNRTEIQKEAMRNANTFV